MNWHLLVAVWITAQVGLDVWLAVELRRRTRKTVRFAAVKVVDGKPMPDMRRRDRRALERQRRGTH